MLSFFVSCLVCSTMFGSVQRGGQPTQIPFMDVASKFTAVDDGQLKQSGCAKSQQRGRMVRPKLGTGLKTRRSSRHSTHRNGTKEGDTTKSGLFKRKKSNTK